MKTIKIKYEVNDKLFVFHKGKVAKVVVSTVEFTASKSNTNGYITFFCIDVKGNFQDWFREDQLLETKEEAVALLLKSLDVELSIKCT